MVKLVEGQASFKCSIRFWWEDVSLGWDPNEFGGVTNVKMPTA
jgi:hypothetical protein